MCCGLPGVLPAKQAVTLTLHAAPLLSPARVLQITKAEYNDFFKVTFSEFMDPACHVHFSAEGTIEFTAMIFVPGMAPFQQDVRGPLPAAAVPSLLQPALGVQEVMSCV